jgi:membrane protease YdiL (CAAX protease family)
MPAVEAPAVATRWSRIVASYREPLRAALRHPASRLFAAVCLLCVGYLAALGDWGLLELAVGSSAGTGVFVLLTLPLTTPVPDAPWPAATSAASSSTESAKARGWLWAQVGVLAVFALLIYHWTLLGHGILPPALYNIPLWTPFLEWTYNSVQFLVGSHMPSPFSLNNVAPVIMFLVPGAALLLLGARPHELGFERGYRSWRVAAVWSLAPAVIIAINLLSGNMRLGDLPWRTLQTTFNSGPFEEFFFRGALMTRLARLLGDGWGIVLSGTAFGLLHVGAETSGDARGNVLAGVALALLLQGIGGVGFAIVFRRTRNLLASSIIHVISNVGFGP